MTPDILEHRLRDWAEEYRGGRYEYIGYPSRNILAVLREHHGFNPDSQIAKRIPHETLADEIEALIVGMRTGDMFRVAQCITVEYLRDDLPIEARLELLREIGLGMSRAAYYSHLAIGRAYMLGVMNERKRSAA